MTTIKPLAGNADIDYNFADVCGPTTYEEMDSLFNKYCKEAGGKHHNDHHHHVSKNIIKLNNAARKATIMKSKTQARVPSIDIENSINKGPTVPSRNSLLHLQRHDSQMKSERAEFSKHATMRLDPRGGSISFNQPENDHLQMAKDFNVPLQVYMGSSSPREREQRIIEYIKKTVSDEIREFTKRHPTGKSNKKLEKDLQKLRVKAETDKDDVFKWLNIRTFFEPLKKKLRARIIEGIRDDSNQPIIDRMLEEINKSKDQSTMTSADNKITLENVAVVNNFDLLGSILEEGPSKHFRMSKSVKNLQKKTQQLSLITNNNSKPISPSNNSPRNVFHTETDSKTPAHEQYTWTERKERTFMSHRTDAKSRLFDKVTSSNWNDLGFSPMIQAYITDEKSKSERDVLLQRYLNGDLLSAEEYRFIASTSVSLNSCVDKKFLQKVVNYINPETINALELEIAESILKEYQKVRKEIKNARQDHLKEENQNLINKVRQGDLKMKQNVELQTKRYEQTKIKTRIVKFLDKVEEKKHWKKFKNEEPKLDSSYSSGPTITRQATIRDQVKEEDGDEEASVKQKKKPETDPSTVRAFNFLKAFVRSPTYSKSNDIKLIKHYYHPSSKLISPSDPHQKDFLGVPTSFNDQKIKTVTHEDPNDYKLHIHSAAVLKDKPNFRKFYSGGPADADENIFQGNYQFGDISHYKVTEAQKQVVPQIQAAWRGYKQRKAFRRVLEIARQKEKYYLDEYQNRYIRQDSDLKSQSNNQNTKDFILMRSNTKVLTDNSMLKNLQINTEEDNALIRKQSSVLLDIDKKSSSVRHDDQYRSFSAFEPTTQKSHRILSAKPRYFVSDAKKQNRPLTSTGRKPTESTRRETDNSYANIREEEYYSASQTTRRKSPHRRIFDASRDVITEAESSVHTRDNAINQRAPPKGLLLKQRKLFIAAKSNNLQMILASGFNYFSSDINAKDDLQNTPLFYAAKNGNKEICEFLLKHGALVNTPCSEGNTPLHAAFSSGQCMVVILLISKGGNLNILNNNRQTPVAFGSESLLTLLGLTGAVATYEKYDGNKTLPVTLDNNAYLQRPDQNSIIKKDAILFKFQTLKKTQANVSDENHQLHSFVPIHERNNKAAL